MVTVAIDPLIHDPARLRIVATLVALPHGGALSVSRLQDMTKLTTGNLITCLHELGHAGYVRTGKAGGGAPATVALTCGGRAALDRYTVALQLARVAREDHQAPAPGLRAGDADRDAAAAALGGHFAHGRLTLNELNARLDATLTAATHGELSQATRDLPDLAGPPAWDNFPGGNGQDQGASPRQLRAKKHARTAAAGSEAGRHEPRRLGPRWARVRGHLHE